MELLPDYVQGWYLLQDSSLDVSEKNIIQTALRGDYSLQKVAQELRSQWPEADLKRRDQGARQSSFWGSIEEDAAFDAEDDLEGYDEKALQSEGMNEEGLVAMDQAHREAQEAYAIIQGARRTLKEARTKQKFVKLSRQYYSAKGSGGSFRGAASSSSSSTGGGSGRNDANMTCLACGKVGHRAANCPTRKEEAKYEEESAPFVCYADQNEQQASYHATSEGENFARGQGPMTTAEAMAAGIGIIDGGATKTLASVTALEQLMRRNEELRGNPGIKEVDVQTRPTFSFEQVLVNSAYGYHRRSQARRAQGPHHPGGVGPLADLRGDSQVPRGRHRLWRGPCRLPQGERSARGEAGPLGDRTSVVASYSRSTSKCRSRQKRGSQSEQLFGARSGSQELLGTSPPGFAPRKPGGAMCSRAM